MAKAKTQSRRVIESVTLELSYEEAQTLSALLYSGVSGKGVYRNLLDNIGAALHESMGEVHTFGTDVNSFSVTGKNVSLSMRVPKHKPLPEPECVGQNCTMQRNAQSDPR